VQCEIYADFPVFQKGQPYPYGMTACMLCFDREECLGVCCSVLQGVAGCCSVLQCVAVCRSMLQCVTVCCNVLQYVAVCFMRVDRIGVVRLPSRRFVDGGN